MEGTRIGNYRVVRLVGRGGMGAVYEAVHENLGKRAAIKVLHAHFAQDPMLAARFNNEARALTTMDHPGIVQVFDYGLVDGTPFIAMEFLNGEPLSRRLKRHHPSPLPLPMALRLCRQMASALASAHGHHVVHRDLKPGNVMIVADPEAAAGERVKLFDFGIAKLLTPRPSTDDLHSGDYETRTGMLMGTPTYMSPEQCRGDAAVDDRTDVYALGVILYQMLAGRPPFYGGGDGEVIAAHIYAAPPALRSHDAGIPDEVEGLVYRLLAKQADARPRMAEVAATLEALGVKATGVLSAVIALPPAALEGQGAVSASRRSPPSGVPHNPHTLGDPLAPLGGPLTRPSLMPHSPGTLPSIAPGVDGMLAASARSGARPSWAPTTQTQRSSDSVTPSTLGLAQAGSGLEARPGRGIGRPPILLWAMAAVGTLLPTTLLLQRECNAPPVAVSLPAPPQNPGGTPPSGDKAGAQPGEKAQPVGKAAAIDPAPVPEPAVDPAPVKPRPSAGAEEQGTVKPPASDGRHGKRPATEAEPSARVAAPRVDKAEPARAEEPAKVDHAAESKPARPAEATPGAESKPAEPRTAPAQVEVKGASPTPAVVADDKPRNVQTATMRGQKLGGELPSLPAALKLQVRERGTLVVSYRLCVDRSGHVTSLNRFGGSPPAGTDEVVHAALRGWSYRAQPYPVCFIETFRFEVD